MAVNTRNREKALRSPTLKQVASRAGVHPSTASRALNPATRDMVATDVAARIMAAAAELGYRPDPVAASLRTGRSHLVGVLVPDIANTVFSPILSGIAERLSESGYSTIVADVGSDAKHQMDLAGQLMARRVDGLILATVRRDDPLVEFCRERGLPVVLVNRAEERSRVSAVVSDDVLGMRLAVDHVADLGHGCIGHLAGPSSTSTGFLRRKGFEAAVAQHGLPGTETPIVVAAAYTREAGVHAARQLLDQSPLPTAIVAANDLLALGLYDVMRERGLVCPADISVVGHNDMPLVDMVAPPLTTVRISHRDMGSEAANLLLQAMQGAMQGGGNATRTVVLTPTLIARASTAAPRKVGKKPRK